MAGEPRDEEAGKGESLGYAVTPLHGKEEREEAGERLEEMGYQDMLYNNATEGSER